MVIKILGTGCPKCKKMEANVQQAVNDLGITAILEKVTNITDIMNFGVMMTPALVIDEKVVAAGKVLSAAQIKKLLS